MASTVKSSSQKFWHLKKIARKSSNATTTTQPPPAPRSTQQHRHRSLPASNENAPTATSRRSSSPVGKHLYIIPSTNDQHAFRSIRFQGEKQAACREVCMCFYYSI